MYKVDLHTHSIASPDGALTLTHYRHALESQLLDAIAITDHNTIDFALHARAGLGSAIIIGEEITTTDGEIIGLFLSEAVPKGLPLAEAIAGIKAQGGLVYLPHPFETTRSGISLKALESVGDSIDIVEIYNGRAVFQNRSKQAIAWAHAHALPGAASSDAHGWHGWCKTYTSVDALPTRENLIAVLQPARYTVGSPGIRGVLYPKFNRLRKMGRQYNA